MKKRNRNHPNGAGIAFIKAHVAYASDDCLLWPLSVCSAGYPSCMIEGKVQLAHRFMCRLVHGDPPESRYHAAHSCGNRRCINPRHLSWKTQSANQYDRVLDGQSFNGRKGRLKREQVLEIRRLRGVEDIRKFGCPFWDNRI